VCVCCVCVCVCVCVLECVRVDRGRRQRRDIVIALDFTGLAERLQRAYALKDGESCIERLIRPQGHALKHQNPCDDGVIVVSPQKKLW
jgi:hypothetical protein